MPRGNDFTEINPEEQVTLTWDFGTQMSAGATLSNPQVTCTVVAGTDPAPQSRLIGSPQVTTSPSNGKASQAVMQQFAGGVGGVLYLFKAVASTSDNQILEIYEHGQCQTAA